MPHHWRHLNTAWERLSTALPLPLAFMCPRALCKYTILDLDLEADAPEPEWQGRISLAWHADRPFFFFFFFLIYFFYFTEVFRLVHHFTCIYTSSWISHTSDSHKSFNIDIYISFVLPAVRASFIQGLYFWFRVFKVIIPVYQYITKFFLRFSTLATGTLRSWSARHQFDACALRWCPTDANPSVPMVRAISTFSFVLKEEMKTSVGIPEEVALSSWSPYICYDFYFSYWFC